jgi:hypothetical protein
VIKELNQRGLLPKFAKCTLLLMVCFSVLVACNNAADEAELMQRKGARIQDLLVEPSSQCLRQIRATNNYIEKLRVAYGTKELVCVVSVLEETALMTPPPPGFFSYLLDLILSVDIELARHESPRVSRRQFCLSQAVSF